MRPTESRHALIIQLRQLALAGMTGLCLWGGEFAARPAQAGEPAVVSPPPSQADTPAPVPPAAPRAHEPYLFFLGDGRTTHRPAQGQARAAVQAGPPARSYLYFSPAKNVATQTPAPTTRPPVATTRPSPSPFTQPNTKPNTKPTPGGVAVATAAHGLPIAPTQRSLIFFSPKKKGEEPAKPASSPLVNLTARPEPEVRRPTPLASVEPVPVKIQSRPSRRPQPYLIFQPKPLRDRPVAPQPRAKGTSIRSTPSTVSSSIAAIPRPATTRPADARAERAPRPQQPPPFLTQRRQLERTSAPVGLATATLVTASTGTATLPGSQVIPMPTPIPTLEIPPLGLKPNFDPANLPPLPFVPAPASGAAPGPLAELGVGRQPVRSR